MRIIISIIFVYIASLCFPQVQDTILMLPDSLKVKPDPDIYKDPFIEYKYAEIFLSFDSTVIHPIYLRKDFTDQFLEIYNDNKILPASKIYGFSLDGKFYRSARTYLDYYVFAEQIYSGKLNLYYCRKVSNIYGEAEYMTLDPKNKDYRNRQIYMDASKGRYRHDYQFFYTRINKPNEIHYIDNISNFAEKELCDCNLAYNKANEFRKKKSSKAKNILLPIMFAGICFPPVVGPDSPQQNFSNNIAYFFTGIIAGITYIAITAGNKDKIPHVNDYIDIFNTYNNCPEN